jgi:hypothetical protein
VNGAFGIQGNFPIVDYLLPTYVTVWMGGDRFSLQQPKSLRNSNEGLIRVRLSLGEGRHPDH